jgi:hypothetical protein
MDRVETQNCDMKFRLSVRFGELWQKLQHAHFPA